MCDMNKDAIISKLYLSSGQRFTGLRPSLKVSLSAAVPIVKDSTCPVQSDSNTFMFASATENMQAAFQTYTAAVTILAVFKRLNEEMGMR